MAVNIEPLSLKQKRKALADAKLEQSNAQQALNAVDKDWLKWSALGKQAKKRTPEPPRPSKEDPKHKTRVNNANEDVRIKAKAVSDELERVIAAKSEIDRVKDEIKTSTGGSWKVLT